MTVCNSCGKKYISEKMYETHLATHGTEETPVSVVEVPQDKIILHFTKNVEVQINSVKYFGKDVECPNLEIASEVVRLAREAHGEGILE